MCFLSLNQAAVLESASDNANPSRTGAMGGRGIKGVSREAAFSISGIAARLGVSKNDVSAGVELLKIRDDAVNNDGNVLATGEVYSAVMDGRLPIRRWKPAYEGKIKTKGVAKAATDYSKLAARTFVSLGTVFDGWQEIPHIDRHSLLDMFAELLTNAPEDIETLLSSMYAKKAK